MGMCHTRFSQQNHFILIKEENEKLLEEIDRLKKSKYNLGTIIFKFTNELNDKTDEVRRTEKSLEYYQQLIADHEVLVTALGQENADYCDKLHTLQKQCKSANATNSSLNSKLGESEIKLYDYQAKINNLEQALKEKTDLINETIDECTVCIEPVSLDWN